MAHETPCSLHLYVYMVYVSVYLHAHMYVGVQSYTHTCACGGTRLIIETLIPLLLSSVFFESGSLYQDGTRNLVIDNPTLSGQLVLGSPFFVFWGWNHRWISTHAVLGTWTWLSCVYFQHSHHWVVASEPQSQFELKVPAWQLGVTVSFSLLLEAQDSELSRREGITERLKRALKIKSLYDSLRKSVLSGNSGRLQLKVYSFFS